MLFRSKSVNLLSDLGEYGSINNFITVQLQDLLKKDQAQFNNAYRNSHNDNGSVKLTCNPKNTSVDVAMKTQRCTPLYGLCGDVLPDRGMVFVFVLKQGI